MKRRVFLILEWLFLSFTGFNAFSQKALFPEKEGPYNWFQRFVVFDGTGGSCVTSVLADRKGFIWFGGENGLYRFDGSGYLSFPAGTDSSSLYGPVVLSICEDSDGIIWAGTYSALNRVDIKTGEIRHFFPDTSDFASNNNSIINIIEEKNGDLWLLTKKNVFAFDRETEEFNVYPIDSIAWNTTQENVNLESERICQDSKGRIWIATNNGLFRLAADEWKKVWPEGKEGKNNEPSHVYCVKEDKGGNIWFGTKENGVMRINASGRIEEREFPFSSADKYPERVSAIYCDSMGKVWVSCNKIIAEYDLEGNQVNSWNLFIPGDKQRNSEAELFVNRIFPGRDNSLWLVWISQGIIINFFPESEKFTLNGVPNWIDFNCIQDNEGNLWIGAIYSSLYCLFTDSVPFRGVHVADNATGPEAYDRSRLAEDNDSQLWIATRSGMIKLIKSPTATSLPGINLEDFKLPFSDIKVLSVFCDHNGEIWFGCSNNTLIRYDPSKNNFRRYESPERSPSGIEIIAEDKKGNLWLVNPYTAIFVLKYGSSHIEKFLSYNELPGNQKGSNLWDFLVDQSDNIWFSTTYGIYRTDRNKKAIYDLSGTDGTGSRYADWFLRIMEDEDHNIWALNSFKGIYRFNEENGTFKKDEITDGLNGLYFHNINLDYKGRFWIFHNNTLRITDSEKENFREMTFNKFYFDLNVLRLRSGELAILNGQQIILFPTEIPYNKNVPPVYITEILVNNTMFNRLFPDREPVTDLRKIDLGFSQNNLSLKFASLNYRQPYLNRRYRYFMKGMDKDTVETVSPAADYINMSPGRYSFWFTGSNNDDLWNPEGKTIDIRIHPPFYRSAIAYIVYILLFASLIAIYVRSRMSRLLKEKIMLEVEISQRTSELKVKNLQLEEADKTKTRFFTNIAHEIRTPLSLILAPLDKLIGENGDDEKEGSVLDLMRRNGQRLMQLVNQLLDISRLDSGKMKIILSEHNILRDLRILAYEFLSIAESKNIRYMVDIPDIEFTAFIDVDKVEKIVSNLLSNAFKFTPVGGMVSCNIRVESGEDRHLPEQLDIRISDTGSGIAPEHIGKIFDRFYRVEEHLTKDFTGTGIGLSLTHEFVSLLHGTINIRSVPGQGSEFIVKIPVGRDHLAKDEYIINEIEEIERHTLHIPQGPAITGGSTESKTGSDRVTILVIEDNADLRNFIQESMTEDFNVLTAEDGNDGASLALTMIPDLVITDLMIPGMNGISLCSLLKNDERTSHIPVIMLTAKATSEERIEGLKSGADDYITKPFNMTELKVRIANLLDQREKLRIRYRNHFAYSFQNNVSASVDDRFMDKIYSIIRENLRDFSFDARTLHEKAGMSRVHLFRKLKAITGIPPSTLIRNIRLETAARYLLSNAGNITEISNSVGISNPSYFAKCFRRYFGVSPKDYTSSEKEKA